MLMVGMGTLMRHGTFQLEGLYFAIKVGFEAYSTVFWADKILSWSRNVETSVKNIAYVYSNREALCNKLSFWTSTPAFNWFKDMKAP